MRKVVSKEVTGGGRFYFFLDSGNSFPRKMTQNKSVVEGSLW